MNIEDMDAELATYDLTGADCETLKWEQDDYECNSDLPSPHFTDGTEPPPCGGNFPVIIAKKPK